MTYSCCLHCIGWLGLTSVRAYAGCGCYIRSVVLPRTRDYVSRLLEARPCHSVVGRGVEHVVYDTSSLFTLVTHGSFIVMPRCNLSLSFPSTSKVICRFINSNRPKLLKEHFSIIYFSFMGYSTCITSVGPCINYSHVAEPAR